MLKKSPYVYAIFRVNQKLASEINHELDQRGYTGIKAYIPTIQIAKSIKNGKNRYKDVPMLFNYGFMKIRSKLAYDRQFMNKLAVEIPGILSWVFDTVPLHNRKKKKRVDNRDVWDDFSRVATITRAELKYLKSLSKQNRVYSNEEITSLKPGQFIVLKNYPFNGVGAVVNEVHLSQRSVSMILWPDKLNLKVSIPFDHCLYSIYDDYEDPIESASPISEVNLENLPDEDTLDY